MWVPRERLFEVFSIIANHDGTDELAPLIWSDGRRLALRGARRDDDERDLCPVEGVRTDDINLTFCFEEDEELRLYNEDYAEYDRESGSEVHSYKQEDGLYKIGGIRGTIDYCFYRLEWLEQEVDLVSLYFAAADSRMSTLFRDSSSIQSWFVNLACDIGAFSCELNFMSSCELLFLNGRDMRSCDKDDECSEGFDFWDENGQFSVCKTYSKLYPHCAAARRACLCEQFDENSNAHERVELALYTQDENSEVRAKALKALYKNDAEEVGRFLKIATQDGDWRVRATATCLYEPGENDNSFQVVEQMLNDSDTQVRVAAVQMGCSLAGIKKLGEIVLQMPLTVQNLSLVKAALMELPDETEQEVVREILEQALERPGFLFKQMAREKLNVLGEDASP